MANLAAQVCGAAAVVVSEPLADRRALADRLGGLGTHPDEVDGLVRDLNAGRGADAVIDAVGTGSALHAALTVVRSRGVVASVGVPHDDTFALPVAAVFRDELTLRFVIGDPTRHRDDLMSLLATGLVDPSPVISSIVPLDDAVEAYRAFASGSSMKTLLEGGR